MPADNPTPRDFGVLEERVAHLRDDLSAMRDQMEEMAKLVERARGGWWVICLLCTVGSAASAGVGWLLGRGAP